MYTMVGSTVLCYMVHSVMGSSNKVLVTISTQKYSGLLYYKQSGCCGTISLLHLHDQGKI